MLIIDKLAESRINEAMMNGEFDNLPGQGLPLIMEDLSFIPEELRMAYKVLKNAGIVPPELELRNEISVLHQSLDTEPDDETRKKTLKRLQCLYIRLDTSDRCHTNLALQHEYYDKLLNRFSQTS